MRHTSPLRELGDCDVAHQLAKSQAQPGWRRGVAHGVAFIPAVPGLAPWGFYVGEGQGEGLPV